MEKTAIRFDAELKTEIQNMMSEANATSMADFVRQAVEFYIAYLRQKKSIDFLAPLLAQTIKNEIESVEKNISSMLYKLSVEQAIVNNIVACYNGVNDETVRELREMCSREIAENNGRTTESSHLKKRCAFRTRRTTNAKTYLHKPIHQKFQIQERRKSHKIYGNARGSGKAVERLR